MNKKQIIIGSIIIVVGLLAWIFIESSKPFPGGQVLEDEGREHFDIGTEVQYKTNPPTSGKHYADWIRPGVYETPPDDRNLVHSLEHGYIILSYNCAFKTGFNLIPPVRAHGIDEEATNSAESTSSAKLSVEFGLDDCHQFVDQLIAITEKKGQSRLIITPRPDLDARLALSAWRRLEKWNPSTIKGLSEDDIKKIEIFIDTYRNQGPEKTMEP